MLIRRFLLIAAVLSTAAVLIGPVGAQSPVPDQDGRPQVAAQVAQPGGAPPAGSGPIDFSGYVRVIDGETLEIRIQGNRVGIGIVGIDAPMGNTPCGREAAAALRALVGMRIRLEEEPNITFDERGRRMYRVITADGRSVAAEMVKQGKVRPQPNSSASEAAELARAEAEARSSGRVCAESGWRFTPRGSSSSRYVAPTSTESVVLAPAEAVVTAAPSGFATDTVVSGLSNPTVFTFLPDGRILIGQQNGVVRVYKNGALLSTPFIDIQDRVNDYWDHGLLGMAADPNFAQNGYIYLLYTYENDPGQYNSTKTARLARYTASGDTASPSTEVVILGTQVGSTCQNFPAGADCIPSESPSHSVGNLKFATDGTLFVTTGDAASFNVVDDLALRSQNLDSLAGKVLRITSTGTGLSTNPFAAGSTATNRSKVWAYGLRNPYRFNLRPSSGVPYVGDVGWNEREEISVAVAGANLGWPCYEGDLVQAGYQSKPACQSLYNQGASAVRAPLIAWAHNEGGSGSSAATGGVFYTGSAYPAQYQGVYFYGDYGKNWIRHLAVDATDIMVPNSKTDFETAASGPVDIELGPDGNLYYLAINASQLRRVRYIGAGNRPPVIVASATPTNGLAPLSVQFSSEGTTDADANPLTYTWNFGDGTPASNQPNPQHTYSANGTYTATLTVSDGQGGTDSEDFTITVGNRAPSATITAPSASLKYKVGDVISFSGSATDPDDGSVADSGLSWAVRILHCPSGDCHVHALTTASGPQGSFTVPDHGDDSKFEIVLTATDSGGLTDEASVILEPDTVKLTLATSPTGLQVIYDGMMSVAPITRTTVKGSTHTIEAPTPQSTATFSSWSDGGAAQHQITVGTSDATYTATFNVPTTITFDDKAGQDQALNGQYPSGVVNWGTNQWYHSSPFGLFATKSVSFNGGTQTSATFTFIEPKRLLSLDAYNGGTTTTTVTLACSGQSTVSKSVPAGQVMTISTNWTGTCGTVTVTSSNGWNTNFDNFGYDAGGPPPAPDTTAPVISGVQATNITSSGATITWATDEASDTQVEYGETTSYGSATPVNTSLVTSHSQALSGLTANTTYHYRVKSKDAAGNLATSADFTFTTAAAPPPDTTAPTISGVQASNVTSSGATIGWTTDEPSDSQVEYGETTSYGSSTPLNSSAVTSHSQALTGLKASTTYHYRVKSRDAAGNLATSADFTFTTAAGAATQTVTFDDKAGQEQPLNGQYPSGVIDWGTGRWYHSGPFGAFTTKSISFSGSTQTSATFTFLTARRLVSLKAYNGGGGSTTVTLRCSGQTDKQVSVAAGQQTTIETGWTGTCTTVTVNNTNGWNTNFDDLVHDDGGGAPPPDTTAPTISAVQASNVTSSGATIGWTTNEPADSQVEYGLTTSYGSSTPLSSSLVTSHSLMLSGLSANTTYHYRVKSKDAAGNLATSADFTFTTAAAADTTAPMISAVQATNVTSNGATITWTTDEASDSQVEYGETTSYGSSTPLNSSAVTSHSMVLSGLKASTLYHYRVKSKDAAGNLATSADFTFTTAADTTAPTISGVQATNVTSSGATITWMTNEASDTQVEYGETTSYGSSTPLNSTLVTSHSQALTGLKTSTLYHYRVKSKDAAGNLATSADFTFTTAAATQTVTFDDKAGQEQPLNGQYPSGVIDWGTGRWYHSGPFGAFTTKNISFIDGSQTSRTFTFVTARRLVSIKAYNGGAGSTTITLRCAGQTDKVVNVARRATTTISTGWTGTCTTVTVISSNSWDTNFDDLVHDAGPTTGGAQALAVTDTEATLAWTTEEPEEATVEYRAVEADGTEGAPVVTQAAAAAGQAVALRGLQPGTTYAYRVWTADAAGTPTLLAAATFTTAPPPESAGE